MRYYEQEHFDAYAEIRSRGLSQWSDLHEDLDGYSDFPNRTFLEGALPALEPSESLTAFEYGCGTGPAACFLAKRGYSVRAVDLVPDAIEIARAHAAAAGVPVDFAVEDVCKWTDATETYDVVLDSYCLQSIVLNDDRALVLEGVRRRLKSGGRYVLSTSVYNGSRRYGKDEYDPLTGMVWRAIAGPAEDAVERNGIWYLPHRRHLAPETLTNELVAHGLTPVFRTDGGGDLICVRS